MFRFELASEGSCTGCIDADTVSVLKATAGRLDGQSDHVTILVIRVQLPSSYFRDEGITVDMSLPYCFVPFFWK
jgi:hypothetical protein